MPKVEFDKLRSLDYMQLKQAEEINFLRAFKYRYNRKRTGIGGTLLGLLAVGIYVYTIKQVKQETFLDDFNEPETVIETKKN
ncbi:hypothetical protein WN55_05540 [Dufourea novaeangliae]|uniref:Cytochrome c oxidase assembly factor 3 mitochondrial coiled-coil domain-containing protein n=1 Tax=Dufourea novaeangliae TaxID=178035 RepID=A0A154PN06_DUFNO|nr:hypothetical protein WN55_05540 [Dufourea novaeangliae]